MFLLPATVSLSQCPNRVRLSAPAGRSVMGTVSAILPRLSFPFGFFVMALYSELFLELLGKKLRSNSTVYRVI